MTTLANSPATSQSRPERIQALRARANVIGRRLAEREDELTRHARKHGYSAARQLAGIARRKASIIRRVKPLVDSLGK